MVCILLYGYSLIRDSCFTQDCFFWKIVFCIPQVQGGAISVPCSKIQTSMSFTDFFKDIQTSTAMHLVYFSFPRLEEHKSASFKSGLEEAAMLRVSTRATQCSSRGHVTYWLWKILFWSAHIISFPSSEQVVPQTFIPPQPHQPCSVDCLLVRLFVCLWV